MIQEHELIEQNKLLSTLYRINQQFVDDNVYIKRVTKGETIYEIGSNVPYIVFPIDTVISLRIFNPDDSVSEPLITGKNGAVGLQALLSDKNSRFNANVVISGRAFFINLSACIEIFKYDEDVKTLFLSYIQNDFFIIASRSACLSRNSAAYRISCWLRTLSEISSQSILEITQKDIAETFSIRLATASDACRMLRDFGFIEYERGRIVVNADKIDSPLCICRQSYGEL